MVAKAYQDFGGMVVDQTYNTFAVCQIADDVVGTALSNLNTDKAKIAAQLVRVTNYDRALVQAGIAEGLLSYQKPIIPMY